MENKSGKKILISGLRLKNFFQIVIVMLSIVLFSSVNFVYGHGVGSETFPPVELNGKMVALELSSSQSNPEEDDDQQISVSLIDFDSKITLRDVTFHITAERGERFLFEREFKADNGFLVFNFVSEDTDSIIIEEAQSNFFGSLVGLDSRLIHVKGPQLSEGGLYKFDVKILTADGYSNFLDEPLEYNAGISIAQTSRHDFIDPNYGEQNIHVITYYDQISDFRYDSSKKQISYTMPFEWTQSNINQTSVVHQELVIPKKFGDLLVSGFTMYVNGVQLSPNIVNIDDFFADGRIVHFIIYQQELLKILEHGSNQDRMNFVIAPEKDYPHMSAVTDNGQFRILVSWEPETLKSSSNAKIIFDVTDIFLKNKPVSTTYDFSVTQNDRVLFKKSGISTDSKEEHNIAEFMIPDDVSGIVHLNFKNLDNNNLARAVIPIVINPVTNEITIPEWIRNNALWWSQQQIDDDTFVQAIEYMIQNKIMIIPKIETTVSDSKEIPAWIKNNAGWWAEGAIDDETFVQGLEYLIKQGIINV